MRAVLRALPLAMPYPGGMPANFGRSGSRRSQSCPRAAKVTACGLAGRGESDRVRLVAGGLVEACGADRKDVGLCREGHVNRHAALRAETARLHVAAVGDHVPMLRLAGKRDAGAREGYVGAVAAAAFALAVPALAVIAEQGLTRDRIADPDAGAAAGKGLGHAITPYLSSPLISSSWRTTFFQPPLMPV